MKFNKIFGIIFLVSSAAVVVPQILNYAFLILTGGWMIQLPFADTITHYFGIFYGSLMIPTYKEYHELGLEGILLIISSLIGIKFSLDLIKGKSKMFLKIMILELVVVLLLIMMVIKFGISFIDPVVLAIIPPILVVIISFVQHINQILHQKGQEEVL